MDRELERQLIQKAKENAQAFEELYNHYLPRIYGYLLNRTGQKELAEDLTSDVFAKALANISTYDDRGISFSAWLFKIARNTLIDWSRKKKEILVDATEIHELKVESPILSTSRPASDAISDLERDEKKILVRETLNEIPEKYSTVLSLKFLEEMTNDEIAQILGCRKGSVAVKIHRGLKMMQKQILKNPEFLELNLNY